MLKAVKNRLLLKTDEIVEKVTKKSEKELVHVATELFHDARVCQKSL